MKKKVARSLFAAAIALVVIAGVVIVLTNRGVNSVPADKLGDTVIGERTAGSASTNDVQPAEEQDVQTPAEDTASEQGGAADAADTFALEVVPQEEQDSANTADAPEQQEVETEAPEPTVVDLPNEKEIQLYVGGGGVMEQVVGSYNSTWTVDADIASFEAFNTDEPVIYYDNYYFVHQNYWDAVETEKTYKIGYELSFDVDGTNHVYTILQPSDVSGNPDFYMGDYAYDEYGNLITDGITGYLGVWLYCDMYHDSTYIHLTQEDMTDETVMTSIKLRPTPQTDAISNLKLKAFSYSSEEEFNSEGHYIGTHGYEIAIINQ